MELDLILRIANGTTTEKDAIEILYETCDDNHASCNNNCPVYEDYGDVPLDSDGNNCLCFKSGVKMLYYLRTGEFLKNNKYSKRKENENEVRNQKQIYRKSVIFCRNKFNETLC